MEPVELDIDNVETEEQFVEIIKNIYPSGVYIYAIIRKDDQDSLHHLSNNFVKVKNLKSKFSIFPSKLAGYIKDKDYRFVYHFYQTWCLTECVFSNVNCADELFITIKKTDDLYEYFEKQEISHITIGHDADSLNYFR